MAPDFIQRLYLSTVKHTALAGIEPKTFRLCPTRYQFVLSCYRD